jgi:hypothetical protein
MLILQTFQLLAIIIAAIGLLNARRQSEQQKEGTYVTSIAHFSKIYHDIMSEIPKEPKADEKQRWWYRYWDMFSAETHFHLCGYLDKTLFGLWAQELARNYQNSLHGAEHMGRYADFHEKHFNRVFVQESTIKGFFVEFRKFASTLTGQQLTTEINSLVERTHGSLGKKTIMVRFIYMLKKLTPCGSAKQ